MKLYLLIISALSLILMQCATKPAGNLANPKYLKINAKITKDAYIKVLVKKETSRDFKLICQNFSMNNGEWISKPSVDDYDLLHDGTYTIHLYEHCGGFCENMFYGVEICSIDRDDEKIKSCKIYIASSEKGDKDDKRLENSDFNIPAPDEKWYNSRFYKFKKNTSDTVFLNIKIEK